MCDNEFKTQETLCGSHFRMITILILKGETLLVLKFLLNTKLLNVGNLTKCRQTQA